MSSADARPPSPSHPFSKTSRLEIIPNRIDVEEESRLYDDLVFDVTPIEPRHPGRVSPPVGPPSVFSHDIWLGDNIGESAAFAREVKISGWTSVGDALGGAYVVYDCVIKTKEGTLIHAHKRYSDFDALETQLLRSLPASLHPQIPHLPPKAPLARYRSAFLARRRTALETWLASVLLHPDVGGCAAVRAWVMC
ncbi:Phox-like protein [Mycena belliarum]|uniref:Endosomal/vacuolar adapter protein YPT35 n=1 Tax=Mycena belliarum TaxID=1033014 RepID=A0AAD6XLW8_9AGAR|nr:Phox-like protein [Mycena belliae]